MVHFIIITSAAKRLKNGSGRLPALRNGSCGEEGLGRKGCGIMSFSHDSLTLQPCVLLVLSFLFVFTAVALHGSKHVSFPSLHALILGSPCHRSGRKHRNGSQEPGVCALVREVGRRRRKQPRLCLFKVTICFPDPWQVRRTNKKFNGLILLVNIIKIMRRY